MFNSNYKAVLINYEIIQTIKREIRNLAKRIKVNEMPLLHCPCQFITTIVVDRQFPYTNSF